MTITRGFADLDHGQVHYRHGGEGAPLLMLHSSPGSGRQLMPLIGDMSATRRVIAPDTPGHGDSVALAVDRPEIADYAGAMRGLLDALGVERADVYGSHTGASIAAELAVLAPERIGRVILDGVAVFSAEKQAELLERYAPPFVPDLDGAYLMRAFHFLRDQYLFFPWYDRQNKDAWRGTGLRSADELHAWLVEVLKAAETYHIAYRAAFRWDAAAVLPRIAQRALVMSAQDDPLFAATRSVARLAPAGLFRALPSYGDPGFAAARRETIEAFLADRG